MPHPPSTDPVPRRAGHHGLGMTLIGLGRAADDGRPLFALRARATGRRMRAGALRAVRADGSCQGDR